jgi:hypothetical protein
LSTLPRPCEKCAALRCPDRLRTVHTRTLHNKPSFHPHEHSLAEATTVCSTAEESSCPHLKYWASHKNIHADWLVTNLRWHLLTLVSKWPSV